MTLVVDGACRVGSLDVAVDLRIERGETVALVGPNGAGKSTVVDVIAGLLALHSGHVSLDGVAWDSADGVVAAERRDVGVVFQHYRLFEHLTAVENVAFGLRARGMDRRSARGRAAAALERLGLGGVGAQRPSQLSGGQAQRVALARAVVTEPAVLLLDEPLSALDATARAAVRRDLDGMISGVDACRLLVTHDPVDAHALADRVVVLEHGRVTQRGTLADLAAAPRSTYVADLMGTNLVRGELRSNRLTLDSGAELVVGAHEAPDGPTVATVRPAAIALHRARPEGSPRNVWRAEISGVDTSDGRVRVRLAPPLDLVVEVTAAGYAALGAEPGQSVWASVKASEIVVVADA